MVALQIRVCKSNIIFLCVRLCISRPSICSSCCFLLNLGRSSIASNRLQISLMKAYLLLSCFSLEISSFFGTFLPCGRLADKGVQEQYYFSVRASVHPSPVHLFVMLFPAKPWAEFNQTCYVTSPHGKSVREQHYFSMHLSIRASVLLSPPNLLGRNQPNLACYITSPYGKGVREQHYFSVCPSMRPSSVHLSVTLSPKPLGTVHPNLLHHFPSW